MQCLPLILSLARGRCCRLASNTSERASGALIVAALDVPDVGRELGQEVLLPLVGTAAHCESRGPSSKVCDLSG